MASIAGLMAYLGPDSLLPLTSAVAAAVAAVAMFWRNMLAWVQGLFRKPSGGSNGGDSPPTSL
jgi:hypothetical protein